MTLMTPASEHATPASQGQLNRAKSLKRLKSPKSLQWLGFWAVFILLTQVVGLIVIPWQQTVIGVGKVTVFSPMQRPQNIEAQISGRIQHWYVVEGQTVKAGDVVAELVDIDPKFLASNQIETLQTQKQALLARQAAAQSRIGALQSQLSALNASRGAAIPGAGQKVQQNRNRQSVAEQAVIAAQQNLDTANYNLNRLQSLFAKGLRSKRDLELAQLEQVRAQTAVEQASAQRQVAQGEVTVSGFDQAKVVGDTAAAVANVSAAVASAQETVATTASELAKLEVDIQNLQHRMAQRVIRAPLSGRIVRMLQAGAGETVAEGDILAVVMPETADQAVELYVRAWDVTLVRVGSPVRLQFAGWPAIQFGGWPIGTTGTFAGRVKVVDAIDDGKGRYRVLIVPDVAKIRAGQDMSWPKPGMLRPGTEATGWMMLNVVPLGYELWRQFNALPPNYAYNTVDPATDQSEGGDAKADKPVKRKAKK